MELNPVIMIPARMESTRFPGKPLAPIEGVPMIVYCAKNALSTGLRTYVCTDSKEVKSVCELYNIQAILTSSCSTGTDRIAMAIKDIDTEFVINLQGDEPLIGLSSLKLLIKMLPVLNNSEDTIITGITPVGSEEAFDPNNVKCAYIESKQKVQYLSRKPLLNNSDNSAPNYYKQIGLYAMSTKTLMKFSSLKEGVLEKAEKIELLRWIENGNQILGCNLKCDSTSVDTPLDLVNVIAKLNK